MNGRFLVRRAQETKRRRAHFNEETDSETGNDLSQVVKVVGFQIYFMKSQIYFRGYGITMQSTPEYFPLYNFTGIR